MGKSSQMIEMDFTKAQSQTKELNQIASRMNRELTRLEEQRVRLASVWQSESSDIFQNRMNQMEEDLSAIVRKLRQTADVYQTNAETIKNAELEAQMLVSVIAYTTK